MLSGVKFIPRDQVQDNEMDSSSKEKKKSDSGKRKNKRKGKSCRNSSSDEDFKKIKRSSKKKWYSSEEENSSSYNTESESEPDEKKNRRPSQKKHRSRRGKKEYTSEDYSFSSSGGSDSYSDRKLKPKRVDTKDERKTKRMRRESSNIVLDSESEKEIARKEMGLEWMLRSESRRPVEIVEKLPEDAPVEVTQKVNPKELNPYLKDNGSGYPEVNDGGKIGADQLLSSSLVGDGGASWRLKALKRAQEQAAREGQRLDEVVQERWGSLGELTATVASHAAAPSRAHLHAIKSRKSGLTEEQLPDLDNRSGSNSRRDYLKGVTGQHHEMRTPKIKDSLSWGKQKRQSVAAEGAGIISSAASSLNKFANDGSFLHEFLHRPSKDSDGSVQDVESGKTSLEAKKPAESGAVVKDVMSANQLAAKALQLRLKGKHEEADKLLQEAKNMNTKQDIQEHKIRPRAEASTSRYAMQNKSVEKKREEEDADMHLAQKIMQNKRYSISTRADDEYDFEDGESYRKGRKKRGDDHKFTPKNPQVKQFLTQQERCLFCLENPNRPMHLVISIANYTYLMLPQLQPVVPGHCCILPIQHESATRMVDDDVWTEIRNFKKCLIMMFAKQEKEVVFLETVMGLAQQRRHCMIDCIPLPQNIAKEAPLYFKKAIDEAEDEWSQHNAKKLIDTSQKGLRNSIPKHFPYFHVEFGLNKGFVHVIDDEKLFKSSLGLNVIRGMLQLPEEDMYRRRRYDSMDGQKQAVATFCKEWDPFDWTKQLHQ